MDVGENIPGMDTTLMPPLSNNGVSTTLKLLIGRIGLGMNAM
jgi:hypothetical protein